ncbi:MAG: hypothetical protein C0407_04910 [Desulfobacca sp.]|nr:hypothetical protein [Desulfobacca sp.]
MGRHETVGYADLKGDFPSEAGHENPVDRRSHIVEKHQIRNTFYELVSIRKFEFPDGNTLKLFSN